MISPRPVWPRSLPALLSLLALALPLAAGGQTLPRLGEAPQLPWPKRPSALRSVQPPPTPLAPGEGVDPFDKGSVVSFYYDVYVPALAVPMGWTGNVPGCVAGATSTAYRDATLDLVNYYRAMTGLPADVAADPALESGDQEAALIMSAHDALSHFPDPSWTCYTAAGAAAAGQSNIALGIAGPDAVDAYMVDFGAGNTAAGHRRWILYPPMLTMGTGSVAGDTSHDPANDLQVFGGVGQWGSRPATPDWVAWPNAGYVPYPVLPTTPPFLSEDPRWSFAPNTSNSVDFSDATVSLNGGAIPANILCAEATCQGFGDDTLVWEVDLSGITVGAGMADTSISVDIGNVLVNGTPQTYGYTVTIIDPALPFCGDGSLGTGEQCDDGNTASGDCCDSNCQFEAGPGTPPCCSGGVCQSAQSCGAVCFSPNGECQLGGSSGIECLCAAP